MSIVAHQGEFEFDGAFWDDQNGWRMRWRMIPTPATVFTANPMKRFTKRRGDRSGTRFMASFQPVAFGTPFSGEVMLSAWADSTSGWSVTFEVAEEPVFVRGCLRRGKDRPGTRYIGVLAEIDEDESVVDQQRRARVEGAQRGTLRLSNRAALLVQNPQFLEFLRETAVDRDWTTEQADIWLKQYCGIDSKADLDDPKNVRALRKYRSVVDEFEEWRSI